MPVPDDWEPQNEWIQAPRARAWREDFEEGFQEGFEKGWNEVFARGGKEGKAPEPGEEKPERQAIATLGFMRSRRIALTDKERAAILACTDPVTLERWISRAATARTAAELFADD